MDVLGVKYKRARQWRAMIGWLSLAGIAAGLGIGLAGVSAFPDPCAMPVFYPLLLFVCYAPTRSLIWIGTVLIAILLLLLARRRRVAATKIAVMMLVGGSLMLYAWTDSQWLPSIQAIKIYQEDDTMYRLLYISSEGTPLEDDLSLVRAFVLLDCGRLANTVCRTVGVTDMTLGGMGGFDTDDVEAAHLYYLYEDYADETNRTLMLQIGEGTGWEYVHAFIGCGG